MFAATRAVWILAALAFIKNVSSQDGFSEQDLLRLQQLSANDNHMETITSYSNIQINPVRKEQSASPLSVQYHLTDDVEKNNEYQRPSHGRSDRRKVFRIKNPFQQRQLDPNDRQQEDTNGQNDGDTGASDQYAAMQYSLPPEEFLQKMRSENPYLQQYSTPAPIVGYTATPQPQYYSENSASSYNNNQQSNQISQSQSYPSNSGSYQYMSASYDNSQNNPSPIPPYVSSSLPSNQYVGTPASTYLSSSSPVFLSSQPSVQYVSSPLSLIQTGSPDYDNRVTTAGSNGYSNNYDGSEQTKRMQIDHYDNSANGMRYPINVQQYSNDYPSSTIAPSVTSTAYPESAHDAWQNSINSGVNSLSKSLQEVSLSQYRNSLYNGNSPQDSKLDSNHDVVNSDTHRIGNMPAANNMYLNFVQPDYQVYNSYRTRTRDLEQESSQPGVYSNGDYGWKLTEKKPIESEDIYQSGSYNSRYQNYNSRPDNAAVSTMNMYFDPSRSQYESISKSATETQEGQEFARAAARAHEHMKQQQQQQQHQQLDKYNAPYYGHNYAPSFSSNTPLGNSPLQSNVVSTFYGNSDKQKSKYYADNSNANPAFGNTQPDLITALPYYFVNTKENHLDGKPKQPFDHAKALKNIVPIDVSNVVGNSDSGSKGNGNLDSNNNRYNGPNYSKEQFDQNVKQYYKPVTDAYYKDKNIGYGYNIKTKPDELSPSDELKQYEQNAAASYYSKQNYQESPYNQGTLVDSKRYGDSSNEQINYPNQGNNNYPNNIQQVTANLQRLQNPMQQEMSNILKLNDIPYRLTQGLHSDALRLHNSNFDQGSIPTPIPGKLNQNVGSHQIDVANSILSKIIQSKQPATNNYRPDLDLQSSGVLSTINGFRVANPFNVDLKLVAEMLKGKPTIDESQMISLRDQYNKPSPLKLDLSSLQQLLLKNDNYGNLAALSDGLNLLGNPYLDIYSNGRYPYQGVKYSRSQEEEETIIPIAESSNTHPIGAVIEQDESADAREVSEGGDLSGQDEETALSPLDENRSKGFYGRDHRIKERHRHPNSLLSSRHSYPRKYPKSDVPEPYPLLKPPPQNPSRSRSSQSKIEKRGRRRRINHRPKYSRVLKTEPLFEAETSPVEEADSPVPTLLRPPPPVPEAKSDGAQDEQSS